MEGTTHLRLKAAAMMKLKGEGFMAIEEPSASPIEWIKWNRYKPDAFCYGLDGSSLRCALVECETKPSKGRLLDKELKQRKFLHVQSRLDRPIELKRILVIARGTLRRASKASPRRFWDIWIADIKACRIVATIPKKGCPASS